MEGVAGAATEVADVATGENRVRGDDRLDEPELVAFERVQRDVLARGQGEPEALEKVAELGRVGAESALVGLTFREVEDEIGPDATVAGRERKNGKIVRPARRERVRAAYRPACVRRVARRSSSRRANRSCGRVGRSVGKVRLPGAGSAAR